MICPKCGAQMPEGISFCGVCGSAIESVRTEEPWPEKRRLDERHHYLLTVVFAGVVFSAISMLMTLFGHVAARRVGLESFSAYSVGCSSISNASIITNWMIYITGIVLAMIGYSGSKKREKVFDTVRTAVTLGAELLLGLVMLAFAGRMGEYFGGREYADSAAAMVRIYAGTLLLVCVPVALFGIFVKKNLLVAGIFCGAWAAVTVVVSAALLVAVAFGKLDVKWLAAALALIQPATHIFPNVGGWRVRKRSR